jgi:hypothetical protein
MRANRDACVMALMDGVPLAVSVWRLQRHGNDCYKGTLIARFTIINCQARRSVSDIARSESREIRTRSICVDFDFFGFGRLLHENELPIGHSSEKAT